MFNLVMTPPFCSDSPYSTPQNVVETPSKKRNAHHQNSQPVVKVQKTQSTTGSSSSTSLIERIARVVGEIIEHLTLQSSSSLKEEISKMYQQSISDTRIRSIVNTLYFKTVSSDSKGCDSVLNSFSKNEIASNKKKEFSELIDVLKNNELTFSSLKNDDKVQLYKIFVDLIKSNQNDLAKSLAAKFPQQDGLIEICKLLKCYLNSKLPAQYELDVNNILHDFSINFSEIKESVNPSYFELVAFILKNGAQPEQAKGGSTKTLFEQIKIEPQNRDEFIRLLIKPNHLLAWRPMILFKPALKRLCLLAIALPNIDHMQFYQLLIKTFSNTSTNNWLTTSLDQKTITETFLTCITEDKVVKKYYKPLVVKDLYKFLISTSSSNSTNNGLTISLDQETINKIFLTYPGSMATSNITMFKKLIQGITTLSSLEEVRIHYSGLCLGPRGEKPRTLALKQRETQIQHEQQDQQRQLALQQFQQQDQIQHQQQRQLALQQFLQQHQQQPQLALQQFQQQHQQQPQLALQQFQQQHQQQHQQQPQLALQQFQQQHQQQHHPQQWAPIDEPVHPLLLALEERGVCCFLP